MSRAYLVSEATSRLQGEGVFDNWALDADGRVSFNRPQLEALCAGAYLIGYGHAAGECTVGDGPELLIFIEEAREQSTAS